MNKSYLLLVGLLLVIVLGLGGYALTKTLTTSPSDTSQSNYQKVTNIAPALSSQNKNEISLTVTSPTDGQETNKNTLLVTGNTVPGIDVSVNDQETKSDIKGYFSVTLNLEDGDNYILVVATDFSGNSSEWEATVTYAP